MSVKKAEQTNSDRAADDCLADCLHNYSHRTKFTAENIRVFALLYIADKLDSIDTRLFHLVNHVIDQERRHE